jgi:hypothetical protein
MTTPMTASDAAATPIALWIHGTCNPALRCGGWAWVRQIGAGLAGSDLAGSAGGDRGVTDPVPMVLAALASALADLPKTASGPLTIHAQSAAAAQAVRAALAQLSRPASVAVAQPEPRTPAAFAGAWAELARDKAKATGAFSNPIPKTNLAKGLGASLSQ